MDLAVHRSMARLVSGGPSLCSTSSSLRMAERYSLEFGNFFDSVPKGGDADIMQSILHDWIDEECVKILANCRAAMNEKGTVLPVDNVIVSGNDPN